jgi:hypothetical protein
MSYKFQRYGKGMYTLSNPRVFSTMKDLECNPEVKMWLRAVGEDMVAEKEWWKDLTLREQEEILHVIRT